MIIRIAGILIGLLVLCAGLYYLKAEKDDPESRKIYGVVSLLGGVVFVVALISLILTLR